MKLSEKLFGTHSQRELKRIYPIVDKIEEMRPQMLALSDDELKGKTEEFKKRYKDGESLDDLLPEAFAVVREAGRRVLNMEHYRTAHRRNNTSSGSYSGDENRRGKNACFDASGIS